MNHVEPGDLVLVRSRGVSYGFGRWLTGSRYDHVAVVVHDGQTANMRKPAGALLPAARVLRDELEPRVLRPRWRDDAARDAFVAFIERATAAAYDTSRTLQLVPRIVLRERLGIDMPMQRLGATRPKWICTDAVLHGLELYGDGFERIRTLPLDWVALACGTTNDFLRIRERFPELLKEVG